MMPCISRRRAASLIELITAIAVFTTFLTSGTLLAARTLAHTRIVYQDELARHLGEGLLERCAAPGRAGPEGESAIPVDPEWAKELVQLTIRRRVRSTEDGRGSVEVLLRWVAPGGAPMERSCVTLAGEE